MNIGEITGLLIQISSIIGVITPCVMFCVACLRGQKCLLRSEMLAIYYRHNDTKCITQYEYENFALLYDAYKKLRGNSFIDKVKKEIDEWTVKGDLE